MTVKSNYATLPTTHPSIRKQYPAASRWQWLAAFTSICCLAGLQWQYATPRPSRAEPYNGKPSSSSPEICQQVAPWTPPKHITLPQRDAKYMAEVLSGAVKVDTTVQDDWGVLSANSSEAIKKLFNDAFLPFEEYLESAFPLVHQKLKKDVVDFHGLIYTMQGSDETLKPLVLMAHQDVVPIEPSTATSWTHPPFSGFIDEDNGLIWGRGSSDDKSGLVAVLAALESLLSLEGTDTFVPRRTIVASFGFDEESAGSAADALAHFLVQRYGEGGVEMIVDEGAQITGKDTSADEGGLGVTFAPPATAEKGYMDAKLIVNTPGGHSSEPPPHTGIGYLSRLIVAIEDNPPEPTLDSLDHPALATLLCLRHSPAIRKRRDLSKALEKLSSPKLCPRKARRAFKEVLASLSRAEQDVFKTTQAVDLIAGGVKINALPERSVATINFRIDVNTPSEVLRGSLGDLVERESKKMGLEYAGWKLIDQNDTAVEQSREGKHNKGQRPYLGSVYLELTYPALEAAPRTPVIGQEADAWRLFSSVIRATWKDTDGSEILVVPSMMNGNTDTKSYWSLSRNIFRFSPGTIYPNPKVPASGIHTVDENVQIQGLVEGHDFYRNLILAVQGEVGEKVAAERR